VLEFYSVLRTVQGLLLSVVLCFAQNSARLLIIAHDQYVPQLQDFADWKTKCGMLARVVPLSEVGSNAAEIQSYVRDAYNTWNPRPEYLLLVGYGGQVPAYRYTSGIYTDNYYADMTGDYQAELKYGRFPCRTLAQCSLMIAKTLNYERAPLLSDTLWFRTGLTIVREDNDPDDSIYLENAHRAMNYMRQNGFAGFDSLSSNRGHDVTDVYNSVTSGRSFVMYRGVGTVNWYTPFAANPGATNNGYKLPVVLSGTCMTMTLAPNESMVGDGWLRAGSVASPRGAVAFFGNTRAAGDVAGQRSAVVRGFMRAYFADSVATLGEAALAGKAQLEIEYHEPLDYQGFNLLGDPTLRYWTAMPFAVQAEYDSVVPVAAGSFPVVVRKAGQPLPNALVCVRKGSEVYEWGVTDAQGSVMLGVAPVSPGMMEVTVTGRNVLPFEGASRVADGDAGVASLIEPVMPVLPGAVAPEVKVVNSGPIPIDFPVVLRIAEDSGVLAYRDTAMVSGLAVGETLRVSFAEWQARNGQYTVVCSTRLARDCDSGNDTLSCRVEVVTHDVGVSMILAPRDSIWVGDTVIPRVTVCNFGSVQETFWTCWIASALEAGLRLDYADSALVTVPAQDSTPVDFAAWVPGFIGQIEFRGFTRLTGDLRPENDANAETLRVMERTGIGAGSREPRRNLDVRVLRNPAPGQAVLEVSIAAPGRTELVILDASGRSVATLFRASKPAGDYRFTWSGNDRDGRRLGSGLYFVRLASDDKVICRKVVLSR